MFVNLYFKCMFISLFDFRIYIFWEMLTCALRTQDKDFKIELNNKYCIGKISF